MSGYELCEVYKRGRFIEPNARDVIVDPDTVPVLTTDVQLNRCFTRTSSLHGRCMEDVGGVAIRRAGIYDEHRNPYAALSIKGAIGGLAYVEPSPIEPEEIKVNGNLSFSVTDRVRAVSKHLRDELVMTEWPIYGARLKTFPNDDSEGPNQLPIKTLKSWLRENYIDLQYRDLGQRDPVYGLLNPSSKTEWKSEWKIIASLGLAQKVLDGLELIELGVMYRAMISNVRIEEISGLEEDGTLFGHVADAIRCLQARDLDGFYFRKDLMALDPDSEEDCRKYISDILPCIVGENLAHFHGSGCYHKYLHAGNITIAGEIIDLDSVRCKQLFDDDEEATAYNYHYDLSHASSELAIAYSRFEPSLPRAAFRDAMLKSYQTVRLNAENVTDFEVLLMDSIVRLEMTDIEGNTGDPLIIGTDKIILKYVIEGLAKIFGHGPTIAGGPISELAHTIQPRVVKLIEEYMAENGLLPVPEYVNVERLAHTEIIRLFTKLMFD